jgi:acyl-CoA reductase-like NAD-dependent aldehyde dehydrogenase
MRNQDFQCHIKAVDAALAALKTAIESLAENDLTPEQAEILERYQAAYESAKEDIWPISTEAMGLD